MKSSLPCARVRKIVRPGDVGRRATNGMLRNLLITSENGRSLTTYGVKRSEICTMKFAFLTVVILLYGSVRARGDLEIYPGIQQEEETYNPRDQNNDFFEQFYLNPRWRASIPVDDRLAPEFYKPNPELDARLSERVRQLEEFVTRRRQQLKEEAEKTAYLNNREVGDDDEYAKAPVTGFDRYQLKYPNQQILDDVRPYPHEESDFSFREGEDAEEDENLQQDVGIVEKSAPEASGRGALSEAGRIVDDQAEFAYAPSDPRFYEDSYSPLVGPVVPGQIRNTANFRTTTDQIYLTQRNDGKFYHSKFPDQKHENTVEVVALRPHFQDVETAGVYVIAIVAGISAAATVGLIAFAIGWYNLQKHVKSASDVEYPAYGVTGPNKEVSPSGDRRLAQSAQMYHYQHQKQQIIAMESRAAANERHGSISEADSDEENEEGDYTVYECPGLAPTGEMEVKNPLFQDDPTPAQTPHLKQPDAGVQKK